MGILSFLVNLLFPSVCPLCGKASENGGLCTSCHERYLAELFEKCPVCGKAPSDCVCGAGFLAHTRTVLGGSSYCALCWYRTDGDENRVTERMIWQLKKRGMFADFFAGELGRCLKMRFSAEGETPDGWILTYTPRSAKKYLKYGVDQSEEIGCRLAKHLGIPFQPLFERNEGLEQKHLNARERMENAEDSLVIRKQKVVKGGKYLLLDDIITSGATMETAAKLLYFHGAGAVYPVAVARTMPKKRPSDPQDTSQSQL